MQAEELTRAPLLRLHELPHTEWRFDEPVEGVPITGCPALRMLESEAMGRYVIAANNIPAGTLVCTDIPFAQSVHDGIKVCNLCFADLNERAVTCGACNQVEFCSSACANADTAHKAECSVLSALTSSGNGALLSGMRGLRLFIRLVHRAIDEPEAFVEVEALQDQYDAVTHERRQVLERMAEQVNRFVPPEKRMERVRLARLISRVHANAYGIVDHSGRQLGTGLYARAGLFNHSCAPSCANSFIGRTWRLHTLRAVKRGEQLSVSYAGLYAARAERQRELKTKKGFDCLCTRCVAVPAADAPLDGWRCVSSGCEEGSVAPGALGCVRCGAQHALAPAERAARERPWRDAIETGNAWAGGGAATLASAGHVLEAVETVLEQSLPALCRSNALRHAASKLVVLTLSALPRAELAAYVRRRGAGAMAEALEQVVSGMVRHLPAADPSLAFFRHRLSEVLTQQAERGPGANAEVSAQALHTLRERARDEADKAVDGLGIAYGLDHPTVKRWREATCMREATLAFENFCASCK